MKLALAQIPECQGDLEKAISWHKRAIDSAHHSKAKLVVFPELSMGGFEPKIAEQISKQISANIRQEILSLSQKLRISVAYGIPVATDILPQIGMEIIHPKNESAVYTKQILHEDEIPYFVHGSKKVDILIENHKIIPAICYESLQESFINKVFNRQPWLYLVSVAKHPSAINHAYEKYAAIAKKFETPVAVVNSIGSCSSFDTGGRSAVWDKEGHLVGHLPADQAGIMIVDFNNWEIECLQLQNCK